MSALMIATITIRAPEKFQEYLVKTKEVAGAYGAELLYRGKTATVLTGERADHGLTVIVKFPSLEKINEWFNSNAYQLLVPLREQAADIKMISYELMV